MTAPVAPGSVEEVLAGYGQEVQAAISVRLAGLRANRWLDGLIADYPRRPGKALRPAILLATCQAFGGTMAEGLSAAVSIELLHNAFLVHDDIEDGSERRRGGPTLHRLHGVPLALNAGDALAMIALEQLRADHGLGTRLTQLLTDEFARMARRTIEGQAMELGWRRDVVVDLTPDDYLELVGRKTSWYTTIYPLRAGAMIGSRATHPLADLDRFGFLLGAAFQIRDDLLNLVGEPDRFGKEPLDDLREGKRTLMLIHLLAHLPAGLRRDVVAFLAADPGARTTGQLHWILDLMRHHGSIEFAADYGQGIAVAARESFDVAFSAVPDSPHRRFLRDLVAFMLERDQ